MKIKFGVLVAIFVGMNLANSRTVLQLIRFASKNRNNKLFLGFMLILGYVAIHKGLSLKEKIFKLLNSFIDPLVSKELKLKPESSVGKWKQKDDYSIDPKALFSKKSLNRRRELSVIKEECE
mmetsp:Transcript_30568/g.34998  ORF Transcript_30568/g.34998 Transcript_30568/m.34998 type:complete len:122 (+) Transcript_30568:36-401(+)